MLGPRNKTSWPHLCCYLHGFGEEKLDGTALIKTVDHMALLTRANQEAVDLITVQSSLGDNGATHRGSQSCRAVFI